MWEKRIVSHFQMQTGSGHRPSTRTKQCLPNHAERAAEYRAERDQDGSSPKVNSPLNFAASSLRQTWKEWGLDAAGWFLVFDKMLEASDGDGYYPCDSDRLVGYWEIWPLGLSGRFKGVDVVLSFSILFYFIFQGFDHIRTVFLNKLSSFFSCYFYGCVQNGI